MERRCQDGRAHASRTPPCGHSQSKILELERPSRPMSISACPAIQARGMAAATLSSAFTASASRWVEADSAASSAVGRIARQSQRRRRRSAGRRRCQALRAQVGNRSKFLRDPRPLTVMPASSSGRAYRQQDRFVLKVVAVGMIRSCDVTGCSTPVLSDKVCERVILCDPEHSSTFVRLCVLATTLYTTYPGTFISPFRVRYENF